MPIGKIEAFYELNNDWNAYVKQALTEQSRKLFTTHGLPELLVSDNGPQFTADEFWAFIRRNGIKHIGSAPYHAATNGIAECFVQTFKQAPCAALTEKKTISGKLPNFLLAYRTTTHVLTGEAPVVLLMGRNLKARLDILKLKYIETCGGIAARPRTAIKPQPYPQAAYRSTCRCLNIFKNH